jgi:phosphohistidine phosphatase
MIFLNMGPPGKIELNIFQPWSMVYLIHITWTQGILRLDPVEVGMKLVLIQHAEAVSENLDPRRPLSETGREQAARMEKFLSKLELCPCRVYHSGKLRAMQTAEYAVRAAGAESAEIYDCIGPNDQISPCIELISPVEDDIIIVGHMPFLGKLASFLLASNEKLPIIDFSNGSPCILERIGSRYTLHAYVRNDYC